MTTNIRKEKVQVFNSATLLTTVGAELESILISNGIDTNLVKVTLGIDDNLESVLKLTKKQFKSLNEIIDIDLISDYLATYQDNYKHKKDKADKVYKEYLAIYKKFAYVIGLTLSKFNTGIDKLNDFADFIGVDDEKNIPDVIDNKAALYKITGNGVDNIALFVWKRRGEELFKELKLPAYDKARLEDWVKNGDWRNNLTNVSYFKKLPDLFSKMGIGLVLDPFVKKTVYGYVDWIDGNPLIQISDRGKSLAICWYILFHEIGHVILHQDHQIFEGDLNFNKSKMNKTEQEANDFAFRHLFNGRGLQGHIFGNKEYLRNITENHLSSLAIQFGVSPMFVAFWLHKAGVGNYQTNIYIPHIEFELHI